MVLRAFPPFPRHIILLATYIDVDLITGSDALSSCLGSGCRYELLIHSGLVITTLPSPFPSVHPPRSPYPYLFTTSCHHFTPRTERYETCVRGTPRTRGLVPKSYDTINESPGDGINWCWRRNYFTYRRTNTL